ncbi:hypothetical protein [Thermoactinospora rubra]|uniref:hypothetical protein n=1 Tax=Thermoactinospora rubra TaxID=1088767 RepID=UPI000A121CEF|nr:hypothetical protein [Thermoactinospora rubra]
MDASEEQERKDLPEAVEGVGGESDVVAQRAGVELRETPRPVPVDPVDPPGDPVAAERQEQARQDQEVVRADAGPTG